MNTIYKKKLAGTVTYLIVIGAVVFGIGWQASARFIQSGGSLIFDGVVVATSANSLTVATNSSTPVQIFTDNRTIFVRENSPSDYPVGTVVSVVARSSNGTPVARVIQSKPGSGYGFAGDPVLVRSGEIVSKTANSFTINSGVATITFEVTPSTFFARTSFANLAIGQKVQIIGNDNGSNFVATLVTQ